MKALNRVLVLFVALVLSSPGLAQVTARYIGPDQGVWGQPANWDINQVPANSQTEQFRVEIDDSDPSVTAVNFNLQSPTKINRLVLDRVRLNLPTGSNLLINQAATINGRLDVAGPSATFESTNHDTTLQSNARLSASEGGQIKLSAPSFAYTGQAGRIMMLADGNDSRLELPNLTTISATGSGGAATRNYDIQVTTGGFMDLSNVTSILGAGGNNWLRFQVGSLSEIDLASLLRINGRTRLMIQVPGISLPALQHLNDQGGMAWIQVSQGANVELPALTLAHNTHLDLHGGAIDAPLLAEFTGGFVQVTPSTMLTTAPLTNINGSTIHVLDGGYFSVSDAHDKYANQEVSYFAPAGTARVFMSDGSGSVLDLSPLPAIDGTLGGSAFGTDYDIEARNSGQIDLSGMTSLEGPVSDHWLRLRNFPDSALDMDSLESVTGRAAFSLLSSVNALPALKTLTPSAAVFLVGLPEVPNIVGLPEVPNVVLNLPLLEAASNTAMLMSAGSNIHAPNLTRFTDGLLEIGAQATITAPPFTNIDGSILRVRNGASLTVAATAYQGRILNPGFFALGGDEYAGIVPISARGPGSRLDLSSLASMDFSQADDSLDLTYDIEADNGGMIDLSGLQDIAGPESARLRFVMSGATGQTDSAMVFGDVVASGRTSFEAIGPGRFQFNSLRLGPSASLLLPAVQTASEVRLVEALGSEILVYSTDETRVNMGGGRLHMAGSALSYATAQRLEVGGANLGLARAGGLLNFSIGQLVIGGEGQATQVRLVDQINNGNRGPNGEVEALYLNGTPGTTGLSIRGGSTLYLDGVELYVNTGNQWTHINGLFDNEVTRIAFDDGFIELRSAPLEDALFKDGFSSR
jgi:hypothetical protein